MGNLFRFNVSTLDGVSSTILVWKVFEGVRPASGLAPDGTQPASDVDNNCRFIRQNTWISYTFTNLFTYTVHALSLLSIWYNTCNKMTYNNNNTSPKCLVIKSTLEIVLAFYFWISFSSYIYLWQLQCKLGMRCLIGAWIWNGIVNIIVHTRNPRS